jgi:hypothetical protein
MANWSQSLCWSVVMIGKAWRKSLFKQMMNFLPQWPRYFLHLVSGCTSGEKVMLAVMLFHSGHSNIIM